MPCYIYRLYIMNTEYEDFKKRLSEKLKEIRLEKGLTQLEASKLDMHIRNYQRIENGQIMMSTKAIYILSKNLDVHPAEFFAFSMPRVKFPYKKIREQP